MVRLVRAEVGKGLLVEPEGVKLWHVIEGSPQALKALEEGKKGHSRRATLQEYLTTGKTQTELQPIARVKHPETVGRNLLRSMQLVYPHLPEDIRQEYPTPKQALRARSRAQSEASIRRIRQGMDKYHRTDIEKIEFTEAHLQHIKEAMAHHSKAIQEGTYTGKPVGRPRKNATPTTKPTTQEHQKRSI